MKTKSLWYVAPRKLEIRTIDLPDPGPGDALIEVSVCGICAWDLFIYSGGFQDKRPYPFYFGHEGIGRVAACGPGVDLPTGQRVALRETRQIGSHGGGHMAEYALNKAASLVLLAEDDVPDEHFMIEPTACCVNAINISNPRPGDRIALVGAGYMGSILLQLLSMSSAREIVVFERRPESLAYASSISTGAPVRVVDTRKAPPGGSWKTAEGTFDLVVEATGVEAGFRLADSLVRSGGRFVIFSWQHHPIEFDFGSWHERGITVHNSSPGESWNMTTCFKQAGELLHAHRVDQSGLITHVVPIEEAAAVYEHGIARTDGYIKGVVRFR